MAAGMEQLYIPPLEIQRTTTKLGKGAFGVAIVGKYRARDVCIKTCRVDIDVGFENEFCNNWGDSVGYSSSLNSSIFKINEDLFKDIFKEALRMKGFEHANVMKVIGVSLDDQLCPEIILPLMNKKDLHTFVKCEDNVITYKNVSKLIH